MNINYKEEPVEKHGCKIEILWDYYLKTAFFYCCCYVENFNETYKMFLNVTFTEN